MHTGCCRPRFFPSETNGADEPSGLAPAEVEEGSPAALAAVQKVASVVDQALASHSLPLDVVNHADDTRAKWASSIRLTSLAVLAILPVFAEPAWYTRKISKGHRDELADYMLSGIRYLHGSTILLVEFICTVSLAGSLVLGLDFHNLTCRNNWSNWIKDWSRWVKMGLLVAVGVHLIASYLLLVNWTQQIGLYLCILVPIGFSRSLGDCFRMATRIDRPILGTAVLLVGFLLMSAWIANELFDQPYFKDFSTSLLSLFVLLTTVNSPNAWAATFEKNRLSFFFFFTYMVIAYFLLMQVLATLILNNYKARNATLHLRASFDLLNPDRDGVSVRDANFLFDKIERRVKDYGTIVEGIRKDTIRTEGGKFSCDEFTDVCRKLVGAIEAKLDEKRCSRRSTCQLVISMFTAAAPILSFQFCVCSVWSIAGVQLFGGKVFKGHAVVEGTDYAKYGLWVFNHNDHASALVTTFNLCIVNNWHLFMNGYAAATGSAWSRVYFIAFWCVGVTIALNLVAFFVAAFTTDMKTVAHMERKAHRRSTQNAADHNAADQNAADQNNTDQNTTHHNAAHLTEDATRIEGTAMAFQHMAGFTVCTPWLARESVL